MAARKNKLIPALANAPHIGRAVFDRGRCHEASCRRSTVRRPRFCLASRTPGGHGSPPVVTTDDCLRWLGGTGRRSGEIRADLKKGALRANGNVPIRSCKRGPGGPKSPIAVKRSADCVNLSARSAGRRASFRRGRIAERRRPEKERLPALRLPQLKEGGEHKEGLASLKSAGDDACVERDARQHPLLSCPRRRA